MRLARICGVVLCVLGIRSVAFSGPAADPCEYWPLCVDSWWEMDTGEVWSAAETRWVSGKNGTVIRFNDGQEEVWVCDQAGMQLLQLKFSHLECDWVTVTFDQPVLVVPQGATVGHRETADISISAYCEFEGATYPGSFLGEATVDHHYDSYAVAAGTFMDVFEISVSGVASAAGETIYIDQTTLHAKGIGPIEFHDWEEGEHEELVDGVVCGQPIEGVTPTPTSLPTPTATPTLPPIPGDTNGDGMVNVEDIFFFSKYWQGPAGEAPPGNNPLNDSVIDGKDLLRLIPEWKD